MKKSILHFTILVIICFLLTGCAVAPVSNPGDNETVSSGTENDTENPELNKNGNEAEKESLKMVIYRMSRDMFDSFLSEPSMDELEEQESKEYMGTAERQWHERYYTSSRFPITKDFIDFVTDKDKIEDFIAEEMEISKIQDVVIFEAPNMPMTMCIKSDEDYCFVTINESPDDQAYVYRLYSFSDYKKKYGCMNAVLKVQDEYVECNTTVKMYHSYADVPFVAVLSSLGVNSRYDGGEILIDINNNIYRLNQQKCELFENGFENYNMLYQLDGGCSIIYCVNDTLMVDTISLVTILEDLGSPVSIGCDRENGIVTISRKD